MISLIIQLLAIPGILVFVWIYNINKSLEKEDQDIKEQVRKAENKIKASPKYAVAFVANSEFRRTKPIEGTAFYGLDEIVMVSNQEAAKDLMYSMMTRGYFECSGGYTYPACNVQKAWVEKVELYE